MLNNIRVENFRKHADLTVHFTPGINAIRAANEAGKSTLLEAIAYAYFGTRGLKEAIDDVVTYGMPASKLRVEHSFTHTGVQYRITRSPKGAELYANGSDKPLVTGQTEVTKFMERLFGTTQDMAGKLMLARQKDLGAALNGGPTEAGKMIESLADLDLIDELVRLVGEKLPAGDTAATRGTIDYLRTEAEPSELPNLWPLQEAVVDAEHDALLAQHDRDDTKARLDAVPIAEARRTLEDERALQAAIATRDGQIASLEVKLATELPKAPTEVEITQARKKVEQQQEVATAAKLHAELKAARIPAGLWDEPLEELQAEITATEQKLASAAEQATSLQDNITATEKGLQQILHAYQLRRTELEGKLVKEESCAFCGKDLKDIPEVALVNNPLTEQLAVLAAEHETAVAESHNAIHTLRSKHKVQVATRDETGEYLKQLKDVIAHHGRAELLYARAAAYISIDRGMVPAKWTWTGPAGEQGDEHAGAALRSLETRRDEAVRAAAARDEQKAQLVALQGLQAADKVKVQALDPDAARQTMEQEAALRAKVAALTEKAQIAERAMLTARQTLELAREKGKQILEQAEKAKVALAAAEAQLAEMEANNLLVKKLRAARPAITDKLWASVLGATSTYCADVRGESSVITRVDGRFKINGCPVTGLSGSAEDALGLSIRFALTKTFLPAVDFVMLDEPAAACNDEREVAMLGLLATSGFAQTILVTHSTLADTFADNIITI